MTYIVHVLGEPKRSAETAMLYDVAGGSCNSPSKTAPR